jgi:hypothetical protein
MHLNKKRGGVGLVTLNELYHHGILGMKWGVRRYQNADGSLTEKGKQRYNKVYNSEHLSKKETKKAKRIYKTAAKEAEQWAEIYSQEGTKAYKKADKLTWKSEAAQKKGDTEKFQKYQSKAWKQVATVMTSEKYASEYRTIAKTYRTKLQDIDSGKLKAGRDFVTQTDYYVGPLSVLTEEKVIEKKN